MNILLFVLWDVDPDIFVIPYLNHPIRWYGLSWALGFVLSQQIMSYIYKREGRPAKEIDTLTLYMVIATIAGARLGHVLFYDPLEYLKEPLRILAVWEGGLASHGGGLGIFLGLYLFSRKTQVNYLWALDRLAIVAALTGCLIRLGNLMNSEVVGLPTSLPWGFIFTRIDNLPRHPAQLYEAIYCGLLFILLFGIWYRHRGKFANGFLFGWFMVLLFTLRFFDEFLKVSQVEFEDNMVLNMGQLLSIPFVATGILVLILISKKRDSQAKDRGAGIADRQNTEEYSG